MNQKLEICLCSQANLYEAKLELLVGKKTPHTEFVPIHSLSSSNLPFGFLLLIKMHFVCLLVFFSSRRAVIRHTMALLETCCSCVAYLLFNCKVFNSLFPFFYWRKYKSPWKEVTVVVLRRRNMLNYLNYLIFTGENLMEHKFCDLSLITASLGWRMLCLTHCKTMRLPLNSKHKEKHW